VLFRVRVGAEASIDFELELEIPVYSGFLFCFVFRFYTHGVLLVRVRLTNQSSVIEVETGFGLRGVFQYCVTGTEFVTLGNGIRYTNWSVHTVP
jgi:hypothetical protein